MRAKLIMLEIGISTRQTLLSTGSHIRRWAVGGTTEGQAHLLTAGVTTAPPVVDVVSDFAQTELNFRLRWAISSTVAKELGRMKAF